MGITLREYIFKHDLSVEEISKKIGISQPYLSAIKCNTKQASVTLAKKIERVTGGEVSWIELLVAFEKHPKRKKKPKG
jgi:transcriptional regulator with XRE-family HTH domain